MTEKHEKFDRSVNNVRNLASWAASTLYDDYSGIKPEGVQSVPVNTSVMDTNKSGHMGHTHPINVGASIAIMPEYFVASGWVGTDKKTEFYSASEHNIDSARVAFQQKYYAAGLRGTTVHPVYDLRRYN